MGKKSIQLLSLFLVFMLLLLHNKSALGRLSLGGANGTEKIGCLKRERQALLKFKEGLRDDSGRLSSWDSKDMDCCNWSGIRCSKSTGRVAVLDLHYDGDIISPYLPLMGRINSPSLLELQHLKYLDLAGNYLEGNIPEFNASFSMLQHLDLFGNSLSGPIPHQLGNLSNLRYLNLRYNLALMEENDLEWLSRLSLLRYLDLAVANLSKAINWVKPVSNLPYLKNLHLHDCYLPDGIPTVGLFNSSSSIAVVELSENNLSNSIYNWLFNFSNRSSLVDVDLGFNQLNGSIPNAFGNMISLVNLNLCFNQLSGSIPNSFSNLSNLQSLKLLWNNLSTLPEGIKSLSKLQILDVAYNSLEGMISETHFSNLTALRELDLSSNKLILSINSNWVPPFQLDKIKLKSCKLGPHFPKWLQHQNNFTELDISGAEISDMIPSWFWDLSPGLGYLNLSDNQLKSFVPDLSSKFPDAHQIDLSFNCITGQIPPLPPNITTLTLSNNKFSGSMSFLCTITGFRLIYLDLSNNLLSGGLPNCWQLFEELSIIHLSNNNLSGKLPNSLSSLYHLQDLQLRNNNFSGELPKMLKNCTELRILDLRENKLTGKIPTWIGMHLINLIVLSLPSNKFHGSIPFEICHLSHIQVLDFSRNDLSGKLPECVNKFSALIQSEVSEEPFPVLSYDIVYNGEEYDFGNHEGNAFVQWKGQLREYAKNLRLLKIIDLSSNKLSGTIPKQFASLAGLISLNLSGNSLTGKIIKEIGEMKMLEVLDLSANGLSGEIPTSLTKLNFLGVLNFSNNNFSGKIPLSTQLQGFDPSAYFGNPRLCGLPLPNKCPGEKTVVEPPVATLDKGIQEDEDRFITTGFYISMGLGFFVGFWSIFGPTLFSRHWRGVYFKFLENVIDWFYITIALKASPLRRRLL